MRFKAFVTLGANIFAAAIMTATLSGCGGGGGSSSGGGNTALPTTYNATSLFTKKAVGNTWTWTYSSGATYTETITSSSGNSAAFSDSRNGTWVRSVATGALVDTITGLTSITQLPASFTVGTPWVWSPDYSWPNAITGTNYSRINIASIVALNVTRTVPAGTFTDCIQIQLTAKEYLYGTRLDTVTNATAYDTIMQTIYWSPTVGEQVEWSATRVTPNLFNEFAGNLPSTTSTKTAKLNAGYIAN